MQSIYLCQQVTTQVFLVVNDNSEVVDETFGQFDVDLFRCQRNHKEQLIMREDALAFQTAIVFDTRPTPR